MTIRLHHSWQGRRVIVFGSLSMGDCLVLLLFLLALDEHLLQVADV